MTVVVAWRTHLCFHHPLLFHIRHCSNSVVAVASTTEHKGEGHLPVINSASKKEKVVNGERKAPEWKKLDAEELGISNSMISRPTRVVINGLKKKGYDVYLVGGCVRDLILKRIPKDFDVITSAELKQVRKAFHRCEIVGKRFPICHVHVDDAIVEVSSFSTSQLKSDGKFNGNVRKPRGCSEHDFIRWRNCLQRDFTINGLMLDPYANIVYDYMGGIADIKKTKVRTVIPANLSFVEDSGRILRAIRIAARLHFGFTRDLALSLKELSHSVLRLDKGRILLELNYMFAYGSAEASLRLMWRFGLLEILLPIQASYFVSQGFRRRDERSNMLLSLFSNLDRLVAPDRPCHSSLCGGSLLESVEIARRISQPYQSSFPELLEAQNPDSNNALVHKTINFAALVKTALCNMTDGCYVSKAMAKYPKAPSSDLVFIPMALFLRVSKIFECVRRGMETRFVRRQGRKIDCESLAKGSLEEVRHAFARIVFDTVYPPNQSNENNVANQRP
ncbi:uncharacterized protein LOC133700434 isoform X4 [Populus nigra]|uniref:uncharacterized protein LOC133700434 isoform X4 n=1 Tax=Populus nigra TaxID=3691 RepID=UPI002B26662E|nr:uncharacterized protein LOC133700434 isoform X4 [Populus nigra]